MSRASVCVLCYVFCVLCFVFCVLCFVLCVLCFVFCVLCFVFCVLCFVFCVGGPMVNSLKAVVRVRSLLLPLHLIGLVSRDASYRVDGMSGSKSAVAALMVEVEVEGR